MRQSRVCHSIIGIYTLKVVFKFFFFTYLIMIVRIELVTYIYSILYYFFSFQFYFTIVCHNNLLEEKYCLFDKSILWIQ